MQIHALLTAIATKLKTLAAAMMVFFLSIVGSRLPGPTPEPV
ncbi:hypothetical protein SAMN04487972_11658 [Paracoccus halophilus]|uniref:Uncharacterized protein n=1 Tax=Paracoccus halophilus TaxID=376733 RepID=A0A1I0TZF1_9RHOB|nr:hypothetical protein [Paracoccus halophilus]SFA57040.1 hypothetical protein SAMN04487972_11658 [Paracoccus halophilus]